MPIFFGVVSQPGGITTVQPGSATNLTSLGSTVDGMIKSVNEDGTVQIQTSGLLTLTTHQWDQVTRGSGGLALGTRYYLDEFPAPAALTGTRSAVPALFVSLAGIGVSPTTMLLLCDGRAEQNLAGLTIAPSFTGQTPPPGSAAFVNAADHVQLATSDVSLADAQAVGLIVAMDDVNGLRAIVQIAGVVTLTTTQWSAVTDTSPGMVAGQAYYVDANVRAGHLTATKPLSGAVTQVGVGLSTTQMILSVPFPLRLP